MSKKNLFLLAAGYVAGGIIASIYNKKKPNELKNELEKSKENGEGNFKVLVDNFVDVHQNLLEDMKKQVLTEENIKAFNDKKEEVLEILEVYKNRGRELIEELKVEGKDYLVTASDKLEKLYLEKKDEIDALKGIAPEKISELKNGLLASFEELKNEIKKANK